MSKIIALFNHKGDVSKTTTTFNLGWALADRGHRILMVDGDPQCNLTGMVLSLSGSDDFDAFYSGTPNANLYTSVKPAFAGSPEKLQAADAVTCQRDNLLLLAGHIELATFEPELSMAMKLMGALPILQNLPGAMGHIIRATAEKYDCDIVLVDLSPSIGALNQNLLMQSDYFIVPTSPDYFSLLAIESLSNTLPRWAQNASELRMQQKSLSYKIPEKNPRFIGMISQKYRPRSNKPAAAFQTWIDQIIDRVHAVLLPSLASCDMVQNAVKMAAVIPEAPHVELAQIADFNSLIARSQEEATAVFALTDAQLAVTGALLDSAKASSANFLTIFAELAQKVEALAD
jgi:chromosome partitioning protein